MHPAFNATLAAYLLEHDFVLKVTGDRFETSPASSFQAPRTARESLLRKRLGGVDRARDDRYPFMPCIARHSRWYRRFSLCLGVMASLAAALCSDSEQ
jgi:hypothetical protein